MSTPRKTGSPQPLRRGRIARVVSALGGAALVGGLALLAACADAPVSPARVDVDPSLSMSSGTLATPVTVRGLLRDQPLTADLQKSWFVTNKHATLHWPEVGLRIDVPANTIPRDGMTITATALRGAVVAYDFGPDGAQFPYGLILNQSTAGTNYEAIAAVGGRVRGAYFKSARQIDNVTNTATVDAFLSTKLDGRDAWIKFTVTHFSGYMVSMD